MLWPAVILLGLFASNLLMLHWRPDNGYQLDIGTWGDQALLDGFWNGEANAAGATYRWTQATSVFRMRGFPAVPGMLLRFSVGGLPPGARAPRPVEFRIDNTQLLVPVVVAPRHYYLLAPPDSLLDGSLAVELASATSRVLPDPRDIGIRLDDIMLYWSTGTGLLPAWQTLAAQWALTLVWAGTARRLEAPRLILAGLVLAAVPLLAAIACTTPAVAYAWTLRLLVASALLLLASTTLSLARRVFPDLSWQELRWYGAVTALAITVRLVAMFYPAFEAHDLHIHRDRLFDLQTGTIQLFDTPSEFARSRTIVPPAYYLLASPLALLTATPGVALQGLYAFVDGGSVLPMAIFVRQIGGRPRAALLAAMGIAALPIQLTALWWGFGPQVVGQWLLLVLLVFAACLRGTSREFWIVATMLLCLAFLAHPGVAILGASWLAGYVALLWWFERPRGHWRSWALVLLAAGAIATFALYVDVLQLQLRGVVSGVDAPDRVDQPMRLMLIGRGMLASLRPIGVPLTVACLIVLVRHVRGPRHWLVVAWLLSAALFFAVDVITSLQVRYAYFAIPMVCAGLGLLLDATMARSRWGRAAGWAFAAFVVFSGTRLLFEGVFLGIKPTLMALLH